MIGVNARFIPDLRLRERGTVCQQEAQLRHAFEAIAPQSDYFEKDSWEFYQAEAHRSG